MTFLSKRKIFAWVAVIVATAAPRFTPKAFGSEDLDAQPDAQEFMQKVAGRYAHYDIVAYVDKLPMLGEMRSLVISYGITDLKLEGGKLIESDSFCHAEYKSNLPMESQVDDSFTRAIVPVSTPVDILPLNGGFTLYRPFTPTPVGVRLAGPNDPFPTDPADPRITDDDHDGKPGVTVHMKLFGLRAEIYLARLESFAYTLTRGEDGRLTGVVKDQSKQLVVGASLSPLKKQTSPGQHENAALSPIILVPVDSSFDCARLIEERDQLFPANPPIWK